MSSTQAWALLAGLGLGFGLWCIASVVPALNRPRLARRVAPYIQDISQGARDLLAPPPPGPLPVLALLVEPIASRARAALTSVLGGSDQVARRLRQSGSTLSVEGFRSQQLLWAVIGSGAGLGATILGGRAQGIPLIMYAAATVVCAVVGVLVRDHVLQRAAHRRMVRLTSELPVILEFLTLSLSAGEGILDSLRRVGRVSAGELAAELSSVVAAVGTGLPFGETLTALAADLDLPAFTRCVDQLVGALERGTPLAEVLRAQAQDSREDAKRALLETAGRKEITMMIPLVFLILPVTILFAVFPGIFVLQMGF
ncbi:type II secretion system F family protein [soil metagenome]